MSLTVLVIDDSKSARLFAGGILEKEGYEVTMAEDGKHATEILKDKSDFDFILCDWVMPNMNGMEFLQAVRDGALTSSPIVMMTTMDTPEKIEQAIALGASEYIMKPFTEDILIEKIQMLKDGI